MPYAFESIELPVESPGWMHSGAAVLEDGVCVAHPGRPQLLVFDGTEIVRTVELPELLEPHGFTVDGDRMWVGDVGFKRRVRGPEFETERTRGRVVCVDGTGAIVGELDDPGEDWSPTAIAVVQGGVWVADGYGQSLVHRFASDGAHLQTLTGEEGAGRFDCPHCVAVVGDEVLVCDRANGRIQAYAADGTFRRVLGEGVVVTPTDIASLGDCIAVTDFTKSRLTILDLDGNLLEHVGENPTASERDGWPNARDADGSLVRPQLAEGLFNSPHTVAAGADGTLFVTEWLLGGRLSRLSPL